MLTLEATAVSTSETGLTVKVRDFEFVVDQPQSIGGDDLGPNPLEYTLGAFPGCLNVVVHLVAKEQGVTLTSFSATARGQLDSTKFMGKNLDVSAGYQAIVVNIVVEGDADDVKLGEIARIAETRCPVSDNLAKKTPVSISVVNKA